MNIENESGLKALLTGGISVGSETMKIKKIPR